MPALSLVEEQSVCGETVFFSAHARARDLEFSVSSDKTPASSGNVAGRRRALLSLSPRHTQSSGAGGIYSNIRRRRTRGSQRRLLRKTPDPRIFENFRRSL